MQKKTHFLQRISQGTESFRKKMDFPSLNESPPLLKSSSPPPVFGLPSVLDIQPQLVEAGAPMKMARAPYQSYCDKMDMRRKCSLHHVSKLVNIPGMTNDRVVRVLSNAFRKQLEAWRDQATDCVYTKRLQSRAPGQGTRRSPFNAESIPLLESYFRRNAYPSASDRSMLAKWTGMTLRQIEVWFQNHRNRRRNNQLLNRLSQPFPLADLLDDLTERSPKVHPIPVSKPSTESPNASKTPPPQPLEPGPLNPPAPRHAFPTPFPPVCDYDPFPVRTSGHCRLPAFEWMRSSCQLDCPKRKRLPDVSMDDFSAEFATRLNLRRGNGRKRSHDALESEESVATWHAPTYIYLHQGRHPALIRSRLKGRTTSSSVPLMPSVPSNRPTKRLKPSPPTFRTPRPRCLSSSSTSSSSFSSTPTTPTHSPVIIPHDVDTTSCLSSLEVDSLSTLPAQAVCLSAFEPYAGPHVTFRPLHYGDHGN